MTLESKKIYNILAPVSIGELIDKITILEIKMLYMTGIKLNNVKKELELLKCILKDHSIQIDTDLINYLKEVNKNLWAIEDNIRIKESTQEFDNEFIQLARSVYKENYLIFNIKRVNMKYNSNLIEE